MDNDFTVAIMQPYFMPYIGYWQLIDAADTFVLFDDVNYIKKGWINRNRILNNGSEYLFTLSLKNASQNRHINEHEFADDDSKIRLWNTIKNSYRKSAEWNNVEALLEDIILFSALNLVDYIYHSITAVLDYLEVEKHIIRSSGLLNDKELKAQEKIIDICKMLGAKVYVNPPGAKELYDNERFEAEGLKLRFVHTGINEYKQFDNEFIPGLSIIDLLCFLPQNEVKKQMKAYELIKKI